MRQIASYWLLRALAGLVSLIPSRLVRSLGTAGGSLWYLFGGRRRVMARRHMRRVLGPGAEVDRAAREVFRSYGRYWAETLWVRPRRVAELDAGLQITGLEHLEKAAVAGTGVVLALPHMGNWEPAALAGRRAGIEIVAVAERLPNRRFTAWFTELRAQFGITIVLAGKGAMRRIEDRVRRGAAVALLCDRDLSGRGVSVQFFGEETTIPIGPAALALRASVPLLLVGCYFTPSGHRLVIEEIELSHDPNVAQVTQQIALGLEKVISVAPEQWHLLQPNWPSDRAVAEFGGSSG
ncbi:MAG: phosphatidylinositol mannoside acyltransferase [Actinomycetota bacterium]